MPITEEGYPFPLDLSDDERPLLLIDVDGVLNAVNTSRNHKLYMIEHVLDSGGNRYLVRLRHELPKWLDELSQHFVLVWATMWDDDANEYIGSLLDLPYLPVIPCEENGWKYFNDGGGDQHHKIQMIEHYVGDRPFAWIDDEIGEPDLKWATERLTPSYLVKIDPRMGLLRHHVDKLIAWAKEIED